MQDDLLHAELTVAETVSYAAQLRLARKCSKQELMARENYVIELMGLDHVRDVIIGDSRTKGISGGERKRVCVAIELLTEPKLLFLDEPTSGLDSTTALDACTAIKHLSDLGVCTVVCTIHQPQVKIFDLFDSLILMKNGEIVYQGSCQKSLLFLEKAGLPCPEGVNPADHLLDAISPKNTEANAFDENAKKKVPVDLRLGMDKTFYASQSVAIRSWMTQFGILFKRAFQQYYHRPDIIFMNLIVTMILAFFVGSGIWHLIGNDQKSIQKRVPSLFFTCVAQGVFSSLQCISTFPSERAIVLRERAAGPAYVCIYECVYVHVYMHVCMYACMFTFLHVCGTE
jgi:ATP-binding cassette subfamily G (WHITE) protein 2